MLSWVNNNHFILLIPKKNNIFQDNDKNSHFSKNINEKNLNINNITYLNDSLVTNNKSNKKE